jgi:hypothetical protein
MRLDSMVSVRNVRSVLVALAAGGAIAASCTFSPGPAGSVSPTGTVATGTSPTGTSPLGAAASSGNPGAGGSTGSTTGAGASTPNPDGHNCGAQSYGLQNVPPDLLIVLDKSGSMGNQPDDTACPRMGGACETKWADMTSGINMVVGQTEASIRWGLKYFATNGTCGVADGAAVPIAPNNAMPIAMSIMPTNPGGSTPTRVAITSATTYMMGLTDANPKYILLATDGEPNCIPNDRKTDDPDDMGAEDAVAAAATAGFPVFVVGVGNVATAVTVLNQMAVNGGRPQAGTTKYYPVANTADLVSVLTMIGGQITSCSFALGEVPPVPTNVGVYSDPGQKKIPQDTTHTNGWDYGAGMRSIELFGAACDDVKNKTTTNIQAIYGCPGVMVP